MGRAAITREEVLESITSAAAACGGVPTIAFYTRHTGQTLHAVKRHCGGWSEALHLLGLPARRTGPRYDHAARLRAWGRLARRLGRLPTAREYTRARCGDHATLSRRCDGWKGVPGAFRAFAQGQPEWADVAALCEPVCTAHAVACAPAPAGAWDVRRAHERLYPHLPGKPAYAQPIDFRGLRHEPDCEASVVFLFGMVAHELGFRVERVQTGFPDCEALRCTHRRQWQRVKIEIEFESRRFAEHRHDADGCDIIVCWKHNWPECPAHLEVIELSTVLAHLARRTACGDGGVPARNGGCAPGHA